MDRNATAYDKLSKRFLYEEMTRLRACLKQTQEENRQLTALYQDREDKLSRTQTELDCIRTSTCWRMTAPVRAALDAIKSIPEKKSEQDAPENADEQKYTGPVVSPDEWLLPTEKTAADPAEVLPESAYCNREDAGELLERLSEYDVVCFDVLDTLILRVFDAPTDVFRLLGHRLGEESFLKLRLQAETEARKRSGAEAVDLYEIYAVLSEYLKLDPELGVEQELQAEQDCCYANPYWKGIYDELLRRGKRIVLVSDTCLTSDQLAELLESCGYTGHGRVFASCEYQGAAQLWDAVQTICLDKRVVHISPAASAAPPGWDTYEYPACRELGECLRPMELDRLSASAYRGLVNAHLHCGSEVYSPAYEHGFRYAGYLAVGFCQWLNRYAKENNIDRIFFLARDADVLYKLYNKHFRQVENRYVVTSRLALCEMKFETDPEEFIQEFFRVRAERMKQPMGEALEETDLAPLIPLLESDGLSADTPLTLDTYEIFHDFLMRHYAEAVAHFSDAKRAGQEYFREMAGDAKRICVVDIGWNGQPFIMMRKLFREMYGDAVSLQGTYVALASTPQTSGYVESGIMTSYLFHGCMNQDIAVNNVTVTGDMQVRFTEATFTSDQGTLLKYAHDAAGGVELVYGPKMADDELVQEIQRGIIDFADLWQERTGKIGPHMQIMPYDAKRILDCAITNYRYCDALFGDNQEWDVPLPNFKGTGRLTTLGEMLRLRGILPAEQSESER